MTFRIDELHPDSVVDASAYWLYAEDEGWERWRLVRDTPVISPNRQVLRMSFELDGDSFELALLQREARTSVKFDQRENPEQELPAQIFASEAGALVLFVDKDDTIFVHLELDA